MYTLIQDTDYTLYIPNDSLNVTLAITDPIPTARFDILDIGSTFSFAGLQEVVILDENGLANPAHNLLRNPALNHGSNGLNFWTEAPISGGSFANGPPLQLAISNIANGGNYYFYQQTQQTLTCATFIVPNQKYTLSSYVSTAGLTGAVAQVALQWQDGAGNVLSTNYSPSITGTTAQTRLSVTSTAPSNAAYAVVQLLISANNATNSGSAFFTQAQLEPNLFAGQGLTYPSPRCDDTIVNCVTLPNNSTVRQTRLFQGYINKLTRTYDGKNRIWHVSCVGTGKLMDAAYTNTTYTNVTDQFVIQNAITTTFLGNIIGTGNVQVGVTVPQITFDTSTMTEVINAMADVSNFQYYVDPYCQLWYTPGYFTLTNFSLSDTPDNLNSFPYYGYSIDDDMTQIKRRVTVTGGNWVGPAATDIFSGDGTTTQFSLTYVQPISVTACTVTSSSKKVGINNKDTMPPFDALLDVPSHYVKFNVAPPNAANNVVVTYTYTSQVRVRETQIQSIGNDVVFFDSKVNDTALTTPAAASARAIAELLEFANDRQIIHFRCTKQVTAGQVVPFTSALDGLSQVGFLVQRVSIRNLGGGIYEYQCDAGAYNPDLIAILKNLHKAVPRSSLIAGQSVQNENLMFADTIVYSESFSTSVKSGTTTSTYGTGHYGTNVYGGPTIGDYGDAGSKYGTTHYG